MNTLKIIIVTIKYMTKEPHKYFATCILLNYNKSDSLKDTIKSVRAQNVPVEIIVVDNSTTSKRIDFDCDMYLNLGTNLHCKIRFLIACYASTEYIFTLDDDVMLTNSGVISHYLNFINNFSHRDSCILTANGHNFYKRDQVRCEDVKGWQSVTAGKGRFLFFRKKYLESVPIGFHDFITPEKNTYTGFKTTQYKGDDIVIDDISFQKYANYIFAPVDLDYSVLTDQMTARTGCHQKKYHYACREWWLDNN